MRARAGLLTILSTLTMIVLVVKLEWDPLIQVGPFVIFNTSRLLHLSNVWFLSVLGVCFALAWLGTFTNRPAVWPRVPSRLVNSHRRSAPGER